MEKTITEIEYTPEAEALARFAKALGHPARIKIIEQLLDLDYCYTGEIVDVLPLAQSTVSQHLKELKNAGLIKGEVCTPKVRYCINRENWEKAKQLFTGLFQ